MHAKPLLLSLFSAGAFGSAVLLATRAPSISRAAPLGQKPAYIAPFKPNEVLPVSTRPLIGLVREAIIRAARSDGTRTPSALATASTSPDFPDAAPVFPALLEAHRAKNFRFGLEKGSFDALASTVLEAYGDEAPRDISRALAFLASQHIEVARRARGEATVIPVEALDAQFDAILKNSAKFQSLSNAQKQELYEATVVCAFLLPAAYERAVKFKAANPNSNGGANFNGDDDEDFALAIERFAQVFLGAPTKMLETNASGLTIRTDGAFVGAPNSRTLFAGTQENELAWADNARLWGGDKTNLREWNVTNGEIGRSLADKAVPMRFVSPSRAVLFGENTLSLRNIESGATVWKLNAAQIGANRAGARLVAFSDVDFSPDAKRFSLSSKSGIQIRSTASGALLRTLKTVPGQAFDDAHFSPDGVLMVLSAGATEDDTGRTKGERSGMLVFNTKTGRRVSTIPVPNALVRGADWTQNGRLLVVRSGDARTRVVNPLTGKTRRDLRTSDEIVASPTDALVVDTEQIENSHTRTNAQFVDALTGKTVRTIPNAPRQNIIGRARFSRDGSVVAFANERELAVYGARTGRLLARIACVYPSEDLSELKPTFSPDSRHVAFRDGPLVRVVKLK